MVGILGGMSWESSAEYYRLLNVAVRDALGPPHSARVLIWSVDFAEIAALQHGGDWDRLARILADAARGLVRAGAEMLLLATNTMHIVAPAIQAAIPVPLLHIADPTGAAIHAAGLRRVGLLGTAFTMEQDFYRARLAEVHRLDVIVPDAGDRATVHRVIYDELVAGIVSDVSRAAYRDIIARLVADGAQAIILGCTEIMLLVGPGDSAVPLFDTTALHVAAAAGWALEG